MVAIHRATGLLAITLAFFMVLMACSRISDAPQEASEKRAAAKAEMIKPSAIQVSMSHGEPILLTTSAAEFQVSPNGYLLAFLLRDGNKLSLDDPGKVDLADSNFVRADGKDSHFTLDLDHATVAEAVGKMGPGKRIEIPARAAGASRLQPVVAVEVYDNFPNILLSTVEYKNAGKHDIVIEKSVNQRRQLNARLYDAKTSPWQMWSFHGSSYDWGKDDVVKLTPAFFQPNIMGEMVKGG